MRKAHRGFIPLVAIILLGLLAIGGGTIAAVSIRSNKPAEAPTAKTDLATTTDAAYSAPVSARVASSGAGSTTGQSIAVPTTVEQISGSVSIETYQICSGARKTSSDASTKSLIGTVIALCNRSQGNLSPEQARDLDVSIKEKWQLYEKANATRSRLDKMQSDLDSSAAEQRALKAEEENKSQAESYTESATYPTVLSFTDNYGNLYKRSDYNGYEGPYAVRKEVHLHVGDTIKATVEAKDPKGRMLEYNWNASSQHFNDAVGRGKYTTSNTLTYTLTQEDLQSAGETFRLVYQVRVAGTNSYRFGGGQYDDTGYVDYQLSQ